MSETTNKRHNKLHGVSLTITGKLYSKFKPRMNEFVEKPFPNGESYKDVEKRIRSFMKMLFG